MNLKLLALGKSKSNLEDSALYHSPEFYQEYTGTADLFTYNRIIEAFFTRISALLLCGYQFHTPIGLFKVVKVVRDPTKRYINRPETIKQRKLGNNVVVYHTDDYYFQFTWLKAYGSVEHIKDYTFDACFKNNRSITEHREILRLNAV